MAIKILRQLLIVGQSISAYRWKGPEPMDSKGKEKKQKQVLLRLSPTLWNELASWAEDDFRSINGQIEYLLTECVKKRKKNASKEEELEQED